jgi:hypothetical protein
MTLAALGVAAVVFWQRTRGQMLERESHSVTEAIRRVTKISTVEMSLSNWQLRRDEKDLFGFIPVRCQKTIAVFYRGKVAAGFDLAPEGALTIAVNTDSVRKRVEVRLPPARILYTDVPAPELVVADGSLCNRVTPDDYARLHTDAREAIEREAVAADILGRAEAHARTLLGEVVRPMGYELDLHVGAPRLSVSASEKSP